MNKYVLLMLMFLFLIVVTLVANDVVLSTTEDVLTGAVGDSGTSSASIFSMMGMFFKIITFQIPQIPAIVNIVVFYPLTFGIVYIIVDILKDLIPFT